MKTTQKLDPVKIQFAASKIRIITHPVRMEIIKMLEENEKLNVTQIYEKLNMKQAEISDHLGRLRKFGILKKVRVGKMSIYSLNIESLEKIVEVSSEFAEKH
jgi:DNA-binding transcriptional ArsR family regulator